MEINQDNLDLNEAVDGDDKNLTLYLLNTYEKQKVLGLCILESIRRQESVIENHDYYYPEISKELELEKDSYTERLLKRLDKLSIFSVIK